MKKVFVMLSGKPKGWARSWQKGARHFDAPQNKEEKMKIITLARRDAEIKGLELPLKANDQGYNIRLVIAIKPPKSTTKRDLQAINDGLKRPLVKPDIDNVAKLWLDALVSGAIIEDDKNVSILSVSKIYADTDYVACYVREM